jgi:hypothetical protein
MLLWYARSSSGEFTEANKMLTPSTYKIDWEDLDNKTYRSIATGDMIDTVISKKWSKLQFSYRHLTAEQVNSLMTMLNNNPIYVKAINPLFPSGYIVAQFRCSKASCEMLENHNYSLSFNLVQKKKVNGQ